MSEYSSFDYFWGERRRERRERQARREANHQAYLERQRRRAERQAYLERQARREANRAAYFARVTNNVLRFKAQYEGILEDLKRQGLDSFIKNEYDAIQQKIMQINSLLEVDEIEAARDISLEIGQTIHSLIPLACKQKEEQQIQRNRQRVLQEEAERREAEIRLQARQDFIDQMRRNLETDKESNPESITEAIQKLDVLKKKADSMTDADLQEQLISESDKVDGEVADETVRREVIKAIYQSLKKTGFIVNNPQLSGNVVILKAQKPAGQQAEFSVKLDGELSFKFDNYEGQKCRKDIDDVTTLLDECYGVKLSNRRVLWSNPDRIQRGSKENPSGGNAQSTNR